MRIITLAALLLLSACASNSRFLQTLGFPARDATVLSDEQAQPLLAQLRDLRSRSDALRVSLAREADPDVRAYDYRDLANLGREMLPLERQLRAAGRPVP